MYKKMLVFVLSLSLLLTACSKKDIAKTIVSVPMGNTSTETSVRNWVKDTCPKTPQGFCKTMGQ